MPTELLAAYLASAGAFVDVVKLGWGLGYIDPQLSQRTQLCRRHGVILSAGGTLLEIAAHQHKIGEFAEWAAGHGIGAVEVSNGLGLLTIEQKSRIIASLCHRFMVLAETGSKDEHVVADPRSWAEEMSSDLESGATWVIAEGRESGTAGLYYQDGSVRTGLLDAIPDRIGQAG
jgi:phosphosulfolactate synthase